MDEEHLEPTSGLTKPKTPLWRDPMKIGAVLLMAAVVFKQVSPGRDADYLMLGAGLGWGVLLASSLGAKRNVPFWRGWINVSLAVVIGMTIVQRLYDSQTTRWLLMGAVLVFAAMYLKKIFPTRAK